MTGKRLFIHSLFLIFLPLLVAWFGVSVMGAFALIVFALAWRWMITLSGMVYPENVPEIELETIAASHFVEKVRWCMDRLGIEYTERQWVGVLGVFSIGRSVPELKIRTGLVRSSIGNSPEILRYLWGAYSVSSGENAKFLEPTSERLALEKRLDRYGVDLQVWVYHHILKDRELTQHAWGCSSPAIPAWQRYIVIAFFPVLRFLVRKAFRITQGHYLKAVEHIETNLAEVNDLLADDRVSILGDSTIDYVDITFASLSGLWLQPPEYGAGKTRFVRVERESAPTAMREDIERWIEGYPYATAFISRLYEQERDS
jgi:hypothetical protein